MVPAGSHETTASSTASFCVATTFTGAIQVNGIPENTTLSRFDVTFEVAPLIVSLNQTDCFPFIAVIDEKSAVCVVNVVAVKFVTAVDAGAFV